MSEARRAELAANLASVRQRIAAALEGSGRCDDVELVVVTKFFPAADVDRLAELGVRHVGENRDQEASAKLLDVRRRADLTVHFLGQLQTNKVRSVVRYADVVESVDRPRLVTALDKAATAAGRRLDVLVEVSLDDAPGRGGVPRSEARALADIVGRSTALQLRGVMAVAPLGADPRAAFAELREVHRGILRDHPAATWRSAGMSGDLEAAVAEGATHVRVGTAILGSRPERG